MGDAVQVNRIVVECEEHSIVFRYYNSEVPFEPGKRSNVEIAMKDGFTQLLRRLKSF